MYCPSRVSRIASGVCRISGAIGRYRYDSNINKNNNASIEHHVHNVYITRRGGHTVKYTNNSNDNNSKNHGLRLKEQGKSFKPTTTNLRNLLSPGIPASFYRGGTSKGLMIHGPDLGEIWTSLSASQKRGDLKACEEALKSFFMAAMGSPDENGRQLNGMGGGVSSLSKAVIVERANSTSSSTSHNGGDIRADQDCDDGGGSGSHGDADARVHINYWFVQIGIRDGQLDMAGNCGNLSAAVAPFALDLGLLSADELKTTKTTGQSSSSQSSAMIDNTDQSLGTSMAHVILRNMNTGKKLRAEVQVVQIDNTILFQPSGSYKLDGVSGTSSPVSLSFLSPGGAKTGKSLPTGNVVDTLIVNGKEIQATLSDISNPGVFVDGRQIGWDVRQKPDELTSNAEIMAHLEEIRRAGTSKMGLNPDVPSVPKIVLVYPADREDIDIRCQALSMQQAHKAVPGTLALNLGVASKIKGTIPYQLARQRDPQNTIIGHPSGKMEVGAEIEDGHIKGAKLIRTARWLMDGIVNDTLS